MFDTLEGFVAHRELLIVVDNSEHLIQACAVLVEHLLRAGPAVRTWPQAAKPSVCRASG